MTHLPARLHMVGSAVRVRVIISSRNAAVTHQSGAGSFAGLSYQPRVLRYPVQYAKTEALMVEAPIFDRALSNVAMF